MGLINSKPRFGYDPDDNSIYDYATGRHFPAEGVYEGPDGDWDTALLVEALKSGQPVEPLLDRIDHHKESKTAEGPATAEGSTGGVTPAPSTAPTEEAPVPQPVDKVEQANRDFDAGLPANVPDKVDAAKADFMAPPEEQKKDEAAKETEAKVADGAHQ